MSSGGSLDVDLIVVTAGARRTELQRLVDSLARQSYPRLRLIVVDQSPDGDVAGSVDAGALAAAPLFLRSGVGLNRGRNLALEAAQGDLVAFPDDDAWYPSDLLERVVMLLEGHALWGGVSGRSVTASGQPSNMLWDSRSGPVTRLNCWRRTIAYSIFLRRDVVQACGGFDETLGAPWTSGGETDLILRVLERGVELRYEPSLSVHHPRQAPGWNRESARRGYRYGLGAGIVMRRHRYPLWFVVWRIGQLAAGSALLLVRGRAAEARFYLAMARGRARGWLAPPSLGGT